MALYDGFFDATYNEETQEYDRAYGPADFTDYFGNFIGSGVCVHDNPDSFKAEYEDGTLYLRPGYLFIKGYWLANKAGEGETASTYKGYAVTIPTGMTGSMAVVAHLNLGQRLIEIEVQSVSQSYPDSLVLAIITTSTAEDTRHNTDICGVIDTAGDLSTQVEWAVNYINTEIDSKLQQVEQDIAAQDAKLDAKIAEVQAQIEKVDPPAIGDIKFTASDSVKSDWLLCDGRLISGDDYPELVNLLLDVPGTANITWTEGNLGNNDYDIYPTSIAYGNGKFVLLFNYVYSSAGYSETEYCLYSNDGMTWTKATLPYKQRWSAIAYGNGKFVALAQSGNSGGKKFGAYSTDGVAWGSITLPVAGDWRCITYGNDKFVALGSDGVYNSGKYVGIYSADGVTWEEITNPPKNARSIAYGNGKFVVATSESNISYSTDGIFWIDVPVPFDFWKISFGNGIFLSTFNKKAAYSTDGVSWAVKNLPDTSKLLSITYGNGKFVAVPKESRVGLSAAVYSTDGIIWGVSNLPYEEEWNKVIYGSNKFVAIAGGDLTSGNSSSNKSAYSEDGINWIGTTLPTNAQWCSIAYGNGKFVAVSRNSNDCVYSEDGITWELTTLPSASQYDIVFGNGKFVFTSGSKSFYSTDGINWSESTVPITSRYLAYGNGTFVTSGPPGTSYTGAAYSTDGVNWTSTNFPIKNNINRITFGGNVFVACGDRTACFSEDGITWTKSTTNITLNLSDVAYGNGKFISVSDNGNNSTVFAIYSSDLAKTWNNLYILNPSSFSEVTYGNGKFVSVGGYVSSGYSSNGTDWGFTQVPNDSSNGLVLVGYGAGIFISLLGREGVTFYTNLTDSARLPKLSASGIPAYIKAEEAKT